MGVLMTEVVESKPRIIKDEEVMGGAARIEGTRIHVSDVFSYYKGGKSPEEISEAFDITLSAVHSAISYYYAHPEEMKKEQAEKEQIIREAKENTHQSLVIEYVFI